MSGLDARVPELVAGVDIRTLPLSAVDSFVLSRVDGRTRGAEIVAMTGLPGEQVHEILGRLIALGAIRLQPEPAPRGANAAPAAPATSSPSGIRAHGGSAAPTPQSGLYGAQRGSRPPSASFAPVGEPRRSPTSQSHAPVGAAPESGRPRSQTPSASSTPPRRRPSTGSSPRRVFAESSITAPPPDVRTMPPRARVSTPARPRTPVPDGPTRRSSEPAGTPVSAPAARITTPPSERGSIPVTLPPLSLPPSLSPSAPLFSAPPTASRSGASDSGFDERATGQVHAHASSLAAPAATIAPSAPSGPRYDEAELDEQVDLPRERRKQVLDLYYQLGELDYYALLGIAQEADKKQVRAAYFALSKAFHPDSMFRKELGSFKAKMTAVFQALTEAYETLSKKKAREEYDAYLRSTRSVQEAERTLATDEVAQADAAVDVPRPPPLPHTDYELPPPTPVPAPPREVSPEARRIARELLERRLRGLPGRPSPTGAPAPLSSGPAPNVPPRPSAPLDRQELVMQLGRTLIDVGKMTGNADKLTRALAHSRAAFERGDIAGSVQHMARAFSLAPERVDLHQEYERLSQMLAQKLADDYEEQARFEVKQNKWAAAAISWGKVCEGKPEDSAAHRQAAYALLKAGGDLRGAQKYAQRAVFLAPNDIDARVLLAQTYLTLGLKLNAKRELDAAAKLDPAHEVVKNLLSDLNK